MRFGVTVFLTDQGIDPVTAARAAEERGFSSLFMPEHTHVPASRATPAPMGEPLPEQYYRCLDPFVALMAAAAATERLRVGTGICLVAQHDPIDLAKQVASIDVLSGGRFDFGIGFGWNVEEMAHHGVDYARRREVVREKMLAMKALWSSETAGFDGEFVRFAPSFSWPKPSQRPNPPVFIGGAGGPKLFAAIAEYADGWMPIGGRGVKAKLPLLQDAFASAGRDPADIRVVPFGSIPDPGKLEYFASLGIDELIIGLTYGSADVVLPEMDKIAEMVAPFVN
ncbi:MAG TPA: LLM class F420-dependent oxidoreductase [Actinomycetota bacterium]